MSGKADKAKGRVKKAVGDLVDDDDLKSQGEADETAGEVKETLSKAKKWAEDKIDDIKDRLS